MGDKSILQQGIFDDPEGVCIAIHDQDLIVHEHVDIPAEKALKNK
jgi:hypothetical protein